MKKSRMQKKDKIRDGQKQRMLREKEMRERRTERENETNRGKGGRGGRREETMDGWREGWIDRLEEGMDEGSKN